MKKILKLLTVPVLSLSFMTMAVVTVSAQSVPTCDDTIISNTGPGSTNEILCQDETKIVVNCTNGTKVEINLDQNSNSGNAEVGDNTNGGGAQSGNSENNASTDVDVDNACGSTTTETDKTPTTKTPVTPAETTVTEESQPEALPYTGDLTTAEKVGIAVASLLSLAVLSRISLAFYHKLSSN